MAIDHKPNLTGTHRRRILIGTPTEDELRKALLHRIKNLVKSEVKKSSTIKEKIEIIIKMIIDQFENSISDKLIEFCIKTIVEEVDTEFQRQKAESDAEFLRLENEIEWWKKAQEKRRKDWDDQNDYDTIKYKKWVDWKVISVQIGDTIKYYCHQGDGYWHKEDDYDDECR